jgi:hypothetical protein
MFTTVRKVKWNNELLGTSKNPVTRVKINFFRYLLCGNHERLKELFTRNYQSLRAEMLCWVIYSYVMASLAPSSRFTARGGRVRMSYLH